MATIIMGVTSPQLLERFKRTIHLHLETLVLSKVVVNSEGVVVG